MSARLWVAVAVCLMTSCSGKSSDTHYEVTYVDEAGTERRRSVPNEETRVRVALFPLYRLTLEEGRWLAFGFPLMLWADLHQNIYVEALDPSLVYGTTAELDFGDADRLDAIEKRRVAQALGADYYLSGEFSSDGLGMDLKVVLADGGSGKTVATLGKFWDRFFDAADSVSAWLRTALPLPPEAHDGPDRPVTEILTPSEAAMHRLSRGWWCIELEVEDEETVGWLKEAAALDSLSSFINLTLYRAGSSELSPEMRAHVIARAQRRAGSLPEALRLVVEAAHLQRTERETVERALALATDLYPSEPVVHEVTAEILLGWGDQDRAFARYERALELKPWRRRLFEFLIRLHREAGREQAALDLSRERVKRYPRDPDARFLLGHLLTLRGEYPAARTEFRGALAHDPEHARANEGLGLVDFRLGDLEGAVASFRRALTAAEPAGRCEVYQELARAYFERGLVSQALEVLEEGQTDLAAVDHVLAWRLEVESGRYLAELGNYAFALAEFRASPLRREVAFSWIPELSEALVLVEMGRVDEARAVVEGTRRMIERPEVEQAALEMTVLGEVALAEGNLREALEHFQFIGALDPARRDNALRIAQVYSRMGEPSRADSVLAAAEMFFPNDPEILSARARVLEAGGRLGEAVEHLRTAVDLWEGADAGIPHVEEARRRLSRLQSRGQATR